MTNDNARSEQPPDGLGALEELRRREWELTDFIENAPIGLHWVGADGRILWANQAELDLLGYTREEYIGRHIAEFHADEDAISDILARLERNETLHDYEARLRSKDGSLRYVLISSNVRREGGEFIHTRCFTRDITQRKLAETNQFHMAAIVESSDDAIISKKLDGTILSWNPGAERLYGYTPDEAIGQPVTMLIPPDHQDEEPQIIKRIKRGERIDHYETVRVRKDGARIDISLTVSPVKDASGRIIGASKIARDISGRKRAAETQAFLAEASREIASSLDYETTLANVARMTVPGFADWCTVDVVEDDGSLKRLAVAHVDPAKVEWAHELQKRYPDDPKAQHGIPNVLRTGRSELYAEIPDALLVEVARDAEHLRLCREIGFASAILTPLVAHGRTLGAISLITAESGRRYNAEDLALAENLAARAALAIDNARLYRTAQNANHLKDEFLATLSHELRTPLTAILGWTHLLRSGQSGDKSAAEILETIERNARSQAQLIDDLLDVSRIITGKLRLDIRRVDPASFIETTIEALRPAAEAKDIRIQKVMDTAVISVAGDPARLQQIVWNLLSNAIKFTPKGGRVQVRLERINSHIEIAVSDTGAGIKPEFLPHVFERFRQADQKTTRQHGGLGLGLAIVRHLVELHGGAVGAESAGEGRGATFIVKLPVVSVYQKEDFAERIHPSARDLLPSYECPERLDGLKVLVVDDEPDTRELLRVGISQCGAEVMTAGSAQEALAAIEKERPHLLISDIGMPGEDGYELIRKVRALPAGRGRNLPSIALTAYARTEDRLRAIRAGYQMHIPKPVELAELIAVMASLMQRTNEVE
jgi:PAS domain S-box-containing protein